MRLFKIVALLGGALLCVALAPHARAQKPLYIDVRDYGAVGDGITDNCAALRKATAACADGTVLLPVGTFATSCGIVLPVNCSVVGINPKSSVLSITRNSDFALAVGDGQSFAENEKIENLTIEANGLAKDGIYLRWFHQYTVRDVWVRNALGNAYHFGDPTLPYASYGAYVWNSMAYRGTGHAITKGSVGFFLDNATDNFVTGSTVVGSETGIRVERGGNMFSNDHVWAFGPEWMLIGFDDNGFNNLWDGVEADTVRRTGLLIRKADSLTVVRGSRFYNNAQGENGVATGIEFAAPNPAATLADNVFLGADAQHRLALDVKVIQPGNVIMTGNMARNIVRTVSAAH